MELFAASGEVLGKARRITKNRLEHLVECLIARTGEGVRQLPFAYSQLEVNVLAGQKGFELSIRDNDPTKRSSVLNTNQRKYVFHVVIA